MGGTACITWQAAGVERRRDPASGTLSALVVYIVNEASRPTLSQTWLDARHLRPHPPT